EKASRDFEYFASLVYENRDVQNLIKIIIIKNQNMYYIQYIVINTDNQT
ncbi:hypothetical protein TheetDRAFT_3142, partial [Thermoanaerobacter ethanolicus JW 200]